jgi:serpin B
MRTVALILVAGLIVAVAAAYGLRAADVRKSGRAAYGSDLKNSDREGRRDATKPVPITDDLRAVAKAENAFTFDLYARLKSRDGNLFFSPASVSTALAMTSAGARGETEKQMAATLHFDLPPGRLHAAYGTFGEILNAANKNYRLSMANRLWAAKGYPFRPEFLALTRDRYGAELATLDFGRSEEARRTIDGWVEQQTNDRIKDLIPPGVLDAMTRLVLTNAIYFKGNWADEFQKSATQDAPFRLAGGGEVRVPLMHQIDKFRYGEADGLQLVELPYAGGDLSMLVLLPREVGPGSLEAKLSARAVEGWMSEMGVRKVDLYLPRFKTTAEFRLGQTLAAMGMPLAFSDDADFSGMSSAESLKISEVIHKAFVDVNEQGTEAAAATAIVVAPTAARVSPEEPPVLFRSDRPFLFLIRDHRSGAILFVGRVTDPTK